MPSIEDLYFVLCLRILLTPLTYHFLVCLYSFRCKYLSLAYSSVWLFHAFFEISLVVHRSSLPRFRPRVLLTVPYCLLPSYFMKCYDTYWPFDIVRSTWVFPDFQARNNDVCKRKLFHGSRFKRELQPHDIIEFRKNGWPNKYNIMVSLQCQWSRQDKNDTWNFRSGESRLVAKVSLG